MVAEITDKVHSRTEGWRMDSKSEDSTARLRRDIAALTAKVERCKFSNLWYYGSWAVIILAAPIVGHVIAALIKR